jgi:hypothetical protein
MVKILFEILTSSKAQFKFRELEGYRNFWPVVDILKTRLKCTSERARKQVTNILADKAKAKVCGLYLAASNLLINTIQIAKKSSRGKSGLEI